jgi:hypothetical protein
MPSFSYFPAHHEARDVLEEHERDAPLRAELHEMRALLRGLAEQDAVVRDDARREPMTVAKPVTSVSPKRALNSSSREPSTIRAMTSRMS